MTEATVFELFSDPQDTIPSVIEQVTWESRSQFLPVREVPPAIDISQKIGAFHGSATEMVPSLLERAGWPLVFRRSEARHLLSHDLIVDTGTISGIALELKRRTDDQTLHSLRIFKLTAREVAQRLVDLAQTRSVQEIAGGSRFDPTAASDMLLAASDMLRALSLLLQGEPKGSPSSATDLNAEWAEFQGLISAWKKERGATSSLTRMVMCPAYQRIIGMGQRAIPMILKQIEAEGDDPDHWNWALSSITGESPVPEKDLGNTMKIARTWLAWARGKYAW